MDLTTFLRQYTTASPGAVTSIPVLRRAFQAAAGHGIGRAEIILGLSAMGHLVAARQGDTALCVGLALRPEPAAALPTAVGATTPKVPEPAALTMAMSV